jgi:predicted permease
LFCGRAGEVAGSSPASVTSASVGASLRQARHLLKLMAFLFLFFTVVLSLCVVGLIVLALASILGSVRDDWKLKKPERKPRPGDY